jgi:tetratricopeptide (TPR) repeat protein
MATNKRVSRSRKRELEAPDEFLTFSGKLLKLAAENRQKIVTGGAVLLALILIGSGVQYYSFYTDKKASELLDEGIKKTEAARKTGDPIKVYKAASGDFKTLLDTYPEKKAGKIARVMFADIAFAAQDYDVAIALYKGAITDFNKDPLYEHLILTSLAYACEQKKDYENAVKYMKMIDAGSDRQLHDEVLFTLGRLQSKVNPDKKGNEYYQKILKEYPKSVYADMAREKAGSAF